MLHKIIPYFSRYEKELAILDIVKNAEKEKKSLAISLHGPADTWIHEWITKRGHSVSENGRDLAIFIDQPLNKRSIGTTIKKFKKVAILSPSEDAGRLPSFLSKDINKNAILNEEEVEKSGGQIKDICYGLWNLAFFNFKEIRFNRFELSATVWLIALLVLLFSATYPPDDLLRHAKAYAYGYDYKNLFAYSWNFSFDPYLLFDYLAGFLDASFGVLGLKVMQVLCFITLSAAFFIHTKNWDDRFRAFVFVLLIYILGSRIALARPAVFEAFLFVIGLALNGLPAVLLGVFMGSLYYLFPIFLIPLALVRKEYAISLAISLLLWIGYAGFDYFNDVYIFVYSILTNRIFSIEENGTILYALGQPAVLLLLFLFVKSRNLTYALPLILFLLFNQLRFLDIIIPLLGISLIEKNIGIDKLKLGFVESVFLFAILISLATSAFPSYTLENIKIENARVLCGDMLCMFNTVYTSKNITISPSMEIGLTDKEVQLQIKNIMNGSLDCGFFDKYPYDFLVENSLKEIPDCLTLVDVERDYRIWQIKK